MSQAPTPLKTAQEKFAGLDYQECLRLLTFAFAEEPDNKDCYALALDCLKKMNANDEAELFAAALRDFSNFKVFFDLGYHFIEVGHDRMAIPLLQRAFSLSPGNSEIGLELAIALCGKFRPHEACEVLIQCDLSSNFWVGYQYYWASLLCNLTSGAEQFIRDSRRKFLSESASHEIRGALYALDKLDELRIRLNVVKQPQSFIRDWHFIQYGSAILDYFDDREGQDGLKIAGGRWVYVGVSYQQLRVTLNKLKRLMLELGREPKLVLSMPDRDSTIIAHGVASLFGLHMTVIPDPANLGWEESIVVAANNWNLAGAQIERILKQQTIFAFNHNWLAQGPSTPDVIGLMSQYCTFPWGKDRLTVDPATNQRVRAAEDTRDPEKIAAEFSQELTEIEAQFTPHLNFYKQHEPYLKGGRLAGNKRWRFITDSPISGTYFC